MSALYSTSTPRFKHRNSLNQYSSKLMTRLHTSTMASQRKALRDWLYLFIVGTQLFGMLALDLVSFYPKPLYAHPSSPLHFLLTLRTFYVSSTGDPFFAQNSPSSHQPWFEVFLAIEGLVQLPLAAYLVSQLASRKPTSGPAELAGLAFGCVTFMGAAACCAELWHMGEEVVSAEKKVALLYGTYLPFAVIPALLAVDMYLRLLPRVQQSNVKAKTQ
ncbi:transmembrane protein 6/97 [Trichoderma gracile]